MSTLQTGPAPDRNYLHLLKDVPFSPIFIMGDHRSGTTLLYSLLNMTECYNVVTAYQIICYDSILAHHALGVQAQMRAELAVRFAAFGLTNRKIDGVQVTPDLPEEYGFLLSKVHNGPLRPNNLPRFVELCRKIQVTSDRSRPLLLKNPWDYFRNFMYVKAVFPKAKFIFIQRHPIQIISSQVRAIRSSLASKNAYLELLSHWYAQLFKRPLRLSIARLVFGSRIGVRVAARHVMRGQQYLLEQIDRLPSSDYITIKYEDLCADPSARIDDISSFLGAQPRMNVDYAALIQPRVLRPLDEIAHSYHEISQQAGPYLARYGYEM